MRIIYIYSNSKGVLYVPLGANVLKIFYSLAFNFGIGKVWAEIWRFMKLDRFDMRCSMFSNGSICKYLASRLWRRSVCCLLGLLLSESGKWAMCKMRIGIAAKEHKTSKIFFLFFFIMVGRHQAKGGCPFQCKRWVRTHEYHSIRTICAFFLVLCFPPVSVP